jgi:hypothetical protein
VGSEVPAATAPPGALLAEIWNGTSWSVKSPAHIPGAIASQLVGVSCTSTKNCVAVGYYETASNTQGSAMVEHWNGSSWALTKPPLPTGATYSLFFGVSCTTATHCVDVGSWHHTTSSPAQPLAEFWNGSAWKVDAEPAAPSTEHRQLKSVSCLGTTFCTAVGYQYKAPPTETLAQSGNSTTWATQTMPAISGQNNLWGVRCASTKFCFAVGLANTSLLMEFWNGKAWGLFPAPKPTGTTFSILQSVTCWGTICKAVGSDGTSTVTHTLAESFNGQKWIVSPSANVSGATNQLSSVSCGTATTCMAVGQYMSGANFVTLAEKWNGTSWVITPS